MSVVTDIIIDLDESSDTTIFEDPKSRIQQRAWNEIMDKIKNFRDAALKHEEKRTNAGIFYSRKQSTISVFGRRGEGKTTFILNVLDLFDKSQKGNRQIQVEAWMKDIFPLTPIDPTLIESREHPFLHIISNIKELCEERCKSDPDSADYKAWVKSLCKLARGLRLLAAIEHPDSTDKWEDPQYVVEEGLINATSGRHLEKNFNEFLRRSLILLNAKVFLLTFDDIDTNFEKGWDILETIRKYLTSPNLLVILSGDLELYIQMIRKRQWEMLDLLVKREPKKNLNALVNDLEEQYLLKILKNENRIHLMTINEYLNIDNVRLRIRTPNAEPSDEKLPLLKDFIDSKIKELFFIQRSKDIMTYRTLLCSQPIRTQLQVLRSMSKDDGSSFYKELPQIFLSTLASEGVNPEHLNLADDNVTLSQLACYLTELNSWDQGFSLRPTVQRSRRDLLWLVMGCIYSKNLQKNPGDYFDYFIKIGLPQHAISKAPTQAKHYMDFFVLRYGYEGIYVARRMLGVLRNQNDAALGFGTFQVHTRMPDTKTNVSSEDWERLAENAGSFYKSLSEGDLQQENHQNTLESLNNKIISTNKAFAMLPFSMISDDLNRNSTTLSFFNLLGSISYILRSTYEENQIKNQLNTLSQLKSYPQHSGNSTQNVTPDPDDINEDFSKNPSDTEEIAPQIINLLTIWKEKAKDIDPIPIYILTKIWEKTSYSLERVHKSTPVSKRFAGNILHRFCIVFLNAALFEIALYNKTELNSSNPTNEDDIFIQNINKYKEKWPDLFSWLWACPFWGFYLNPEKERDMVWRLYLNHTSTYLNQQPNTENLKEAFKVIYKKESTEQQFSNMHPLLNSLSSPDGKKALTSIKQLSHNDILFIKTFQSIPAYHKNLTKYNQGAATKIMKHYKDLISKLKSEEEKIDLVLEILNKHWSNRRDPITANNSEWIQACLKAVQE